jgi:uncharacterized protein (DUF305 family)
VRRLTYAAVLLAATTALGACGTAPEAPAPAPAPVTVSEVAEVKAEAEHNDTDVMYLQMMVAHHQQGLEMVKLAASDAKRAEIRVLAEAVDATQSDELTMMRGWLKGWSAPDTVDHAPSAHADHGGLPATGPDEIEALREARGSAFDTAFLNLFVAHQHNAVEMAALEATKGVNPDAKAFAERVKLSRTDQIQQMLQLLNS